MIKTKKGRSKIGDPPPYGVYTAPEPHHGDSPPYGVHQTAPEPLHGDPPPYSVYTAPEPCANALPPAFGPPPGLAHLAPPPLSEFHGGSAPSQAGSSSWLGRPEASGQLLFYGDAGGRQFSAPGQNSGYAQHDSNFPYGGVGACRPCDEEDPWHGYAEALRRARAQGFTEGPDAANGVEAGCLWCPHCTRVIPVYNLDAHLDSKKHVAYMESASYWEELRTRATNNELPPWMELRDGSEYCTLCGAYATHGHLASERHSKRLEWYNAESSPSTGASAAPAVSSFASAFPPVMAAQQPGPGSPPPAHWGDPRHFEFQPDQGWWRCRLCQCWADDSHIMGQKHQKRIEWADYYIDGIESPYGAADASSTQAGAGELPPPAPASSSRDELPHGWHRAWSEDNLKYYYYHASTREVSWDPPIAPPPEQRPAAAQTQDASTRTAPSSAFGALASVPEINASAAAAAAPAFQPAPVPVPQSTWHEYTCPHTGRLYFHNPATGETTWDPPESTVFETV